MIEWCKYYLGNRQQRVKIDDKLSRNLSVNCGVPQGSILGPLFFIIYLNDLLKLFSTEVNILLYADDTVVYFAHENPHNACDIVQRCLKTICDWCALNKLTINVTKTKHMLFKPNDSIYGDYTPSIEMNGECLENVMHYNYLGVVIDSRLEFDMFLKEKYNKVNLCVYQLGQMRKYITARIASIVYKQTVLPLYDYADFLVESGPNHRINRLDSLHEKALYIIDNNVTKNARFSDLLLLYNIITLSERRHQHHCSLMFRKSKTSVDLDFARPRMHLRSHNKVKFKKYRRKYTKILKSPLLRGVKLWDRIPIDIQRSTTKFKFKKLIKICVSGYE